MDEPKQEQTQDLTAKPFFLSETNQHIDTLLEVTMNEPKQEQTQDLTAKPFFQSEINQRIDTLLESGLLGLILGKGGSVHAKVIGIIVIVLTFSGIVYTFSGISRLENALAVSDYWNLISPIIMTLIGYLVGKNRDD